MPTNKEKYIARYNKENYKMYQFRVRKSEARVIEKLETVRNRNRYITSLIKEQLDPNILSIKQIKQRIRPVVERHGIHDVYLFGSYSRGEATRDSDVDIYCEDGDIRSLFDHVAFIDELKEALGKEVDVIFFGSEMHELFKEQLDEDKIKLW